MSTPAIQKDQSKAGKGPESQTNLRDSNQLGFSWQANIQPQGPEIKKDVLADLDRWLFKSGDGSTINKPNTEFQKSQTSPTPQLQATSNLQGPPAVTRNSQVSVAYSTGQLPNIQNPNVQSTYIQVQSPSLNKDQVKVEQIVQSPVKIPELTTYSQQFLSPVKASVEVQKVNTGSTNFNAAKSQLIDLVNETQKYVTVQNFLVESDVETLKRQKATFNVYENVDVSKKAISLLERTLFQELNITQMEEENRRVKALAEEAHKEVQALAAKGPEIKVIERVVPKIEEKIIYDNSQIAAITDENNKLQGRLNDLHKEVSAHRAKGPEVKVIEREVPKVVTKQIVDDKKVKILTEEQGKLQLRVNELQREIDALKAKGPEIKVIERQIPKVVTKQVIDETKVKILSEEQHKLQIRLGEIQKEVDTLKARGPEVKIIERQIPKVVTKQIVDETKVKALTEEQGKLQLRLMEIQRELDALKARGPEVKIIERQIPKIVTKQVVDETKVKALTEEQGKLQLRLMEIQKEVDALKARGPEIKVIERQIPKIVTKEVLDETKVKHLLEEQGHIHARLADVHKELEAHKAKGPEIKIIERQIPKTVTKQILDETKVKALTEEQGKLQLRLAEIQREVDNLKAKGPEVKIIERQIPKIVTKQVLDETKVKHLLEEQGKLQIRLADIQKEVDILKSRGPEIKVIERQIPKIVTKQVIDDTKVKALEDENKRLKNHVDNVDKEVKSALAKGPEVQIIERQIPKVVTKQVVDETKVKALVQENSKLNGRLLELQRDVDNLKAKGPEIKVIERQIPKVVTHQVVDETKVKSLSEEFNKLQARLFEIQREIDTLKSKGPEIKIIERQIPKVVTHQVIDETKVKALTEENNKLQGRMHELQKEIDTHKARGPEVKIIERQIPKIVTKQIIDETKVKKLTEELGALQARYTEVQREIDTLKAKGPEIKIIEREIPKVVTHQVIDETKVRALLEENSKLQGRFGELQREVDILKSRGPEIKVIEREIPKVVTKTVYDESRIKSIMDDNQRLHGKVLDLEREKSALVSQGPKVEVKYIEKIVPQVVEKPVTQFVDKIVVDENRLKFLREENQRLNALYLEKSRDYATLKSRSQEIKYVDKIVYQKQEKEVVQFVERIVQDDTKIKALAEDNNRLAKNLGDLEKQVKAHKDRLATPEVKVVEKPVVKTIEKEVIEVETCLKANESRLKQIQTDNAALSQKLIEIDKQVAALKSGSNEIHVKLVEQVRIDEQRIRAAIELNRALNKELAEKRKEANALKNRPVQIQYQDKVQVQVVEKVVVDEVKLSFLKEENGRLNRTIGEKSKEAQAAKSRPPEIKYVDKEIVQVVEQVVEDTDKIDTLTSENRKLQNLVIDKTREAENLKNRPPEIKYVDKEVIQVVEQVVEDVNKINALINDNQHINQLLFERTRELESLKSRPPEIRYVDKEVIQVVEQVVEDHNKINMLIQENQKINQLLFERSREFEGLKNRPPEIKYVDKEVVQVIEQVVEDTNKINFLINENQKIHQLIFERSREFEGLKSRPPEIKYVDKEIVQVIEKVVEDTNKINNLINENQRLNQQVFEKSREVQAIKSRPPEIKYVDKEVIQVIEQVVEDTNKINMLLTDNQKLHQLIFERTREFEGLKNRPPEIRYVDKEVIQVVEQVVEDANKINMLINDNQKLNQLIFERSREFEGLRNRPPEIRYVDKEIVQVVEQVVEDVAKINELADSNRKLNNDLHEKAKKHAEVKNRPPEIRYVDREVVQVIEQVVEDTNKINFYIQENQKLNGLIFERTREFETLKNRPAEIRYVDKEVIQVVEQRVEDNNKINALITEIQKINQLIGERGRELEMLRNRPPEIRYVDKEIIQVVEQVVEDANKINQLADENRRLNQNIGERNKEAQALKNRPPEIKYVDKEVIQVVEQVVEDVNRINALMGEIQRYNQLLIEKTREVEALRHRPIEYRYVDKEVIQVVEQRVEDVNRINHLMMENQKLNGLIIERSRELDMLKNRPPEIRYVDKEVIQVVEQVVEDQNRLNQVLDENKRLNNAHADLQKQVQAIKSKPPEIKYVDKIITQFIEKVVTNYVDRITYDEKPIISLTQENKQIEGKINELNGLIDAEKLRLSKVIIQEIEKILPQIIEKPVIHYIDKVVVDEPKLKEAANENEKLKNRTRDLGNEHAKMASQPKPVQIVEKEVVSYVEKIVPKKVHQDYDLFTHQVKSIIEQNVQLNILIKEKMREIESIKGRLIEVKVVEKIQPMMIEKSVPQVVEKVVEDQAKITTLIQELQKLQGVLNQKQNEFEQVRVGYSQVENSQRDSLIKAQGSQKLSSQVNAMITENDNLRQQLLYAGNEWQVKFNILMEEKQKLENSLREKENTLKVKESEANFHKAEKENVKKSAAVHPENKVLTDQTQAKNQEILLALSRTQQEIESLKNRPPVVQHVEVPNQQVIYKDIEVPNQQVIVNHVEVASEPKKSIVVQSVPAVDTRRSYVYQAPGTETVQSYIAQPLFETRKSYVAQPVFETKKSYVAQPMVETRKSYVAQPVYETKKSIVSPAVETKNSIVVQAPPRVEYLPPQYLQSPAKVEYVQATTPVEFFQPSKVEYIQSPTINYYQAPAKFEVNRTIQPPVQTINHEGAKSHGVTRTTIAAPPQTYTNVYYNQQKPNDLAGSGYLYFQEATPQLVPQGGLSETVTYTSGIIDRPQVNTNNNIRSSNVIERVSVDGNAVVFEEKNKAFQTKNVWF